MCVWGGEGAVPPPTREPPTPETTFLSPLPPQVPVVWDAEAKAYVMPWEGFTRLGEVKAELQLMDPQERCGLCVRVCVCVCVCVFCCACAARHVTCCP